jgi:hypothetical protein
MTRAGWRSRQRTQVRYGMRRANDMEDRRPRECARRAAPAHSPAGPDRKRRRGNPDRIHRTPDCPRDANSPSCPLRTASRRPDTPSGRVGACVGKGEGRGRARGSAGVRVVASGDPDRTHVGDTDELAAHAGAALDSRAPACRIADHPRAAREGWGRPSPCVCSCGGGGNCRARRPRIGQCDRARTSRSRTHEPTLACQAGPDRVVDRDAAGRLHTDAHADGHRGHGSRPHHAGCAVVRRDGVMPRRLSRGYGRGSVRARDQ